MNNQPDKSSSFCQPEELSDKQSDSQQSYLKPETKATKRQKLALSNQKVENTVEIQYDTVNQQENENNDSQIITVETKICLICQIDQPFRTKHCRECEQCVALHDHHCPWLGNCIGQRNRLYFYWYLVFQNIEVYIYNLILIYSFESDDSILTFIQDNLFRIGIIVLNSFISILITFLWIFHTYLAFRNITTCKYYLGEYLSWDRVFYLKQWPYQYGSPFSKGVRWNLWEYCCRSYEDMDAHPWQVPSKLPVKANQKMGLTLLVSRILAITLFLSLSVQLMQQDQQTIKLLNWYFSVFRGFIAGNTGFTIPELLNKANEAQISIFSGAVLAVLSFQSLLGSKCSRTLLAQLTFCALVIMYAPVYDRIDMSNLTDVILNVSVFGSTLMMLNS